MVKYVSNVPCSWRMLTRVDRLSWYTPPCHVYSDWRALQTSLLFHGSMSLLCYFKSVYRCLLDPNGPLSADVQPASKVAITFTRPRGAQRGKLHVPTSDEWPRDSYAVIVVKGEHSVGHLSPKIPCFAPSSLEGSSITAIVTRRRKRSNRLATAVFPFSRYLPICASCLAVRRPCDPRACVFVLASRSRPTEVWLTQTNVVL